MKRKLFIVPLALALVAGPLAAPAKTSSPGNSVLGVNVVLTVDVSRSSLTLLGAYGKVRDGEPEIRALLFPDVKTYLQER